MFRYISRVFARQVVRRIAVIAVGALFVLVPTLWGGLQANAASQYDNLYNTTDDLFIGTNDFFDANCENENYVTNWYSTALEIDDYAVEEPTWRDSLQNAVNGDGRWIVTQVTSIAGGGTANSYNIIWTEDSSLTVTFNPGEIVAGGNNVQSIRVLSNAEMTGTSSCEEIYAYFYNSDFRISNDDIANETVTAHLVYIDENLITYPEGYEGELIENRSPTPGLSGEQYAPNWTILTANNWKAEIRDLRFVTFDKIFWTCSEDGNSIQSGHEGLVPVIEWELYNQNNNVIDEGILSAGAHWNYQFPEQNTDTTYTIRGKYDCGGSVGFSAVGEKEFTITETGILKEQDFFADCVTLEPPFVAVQACIENVFRVIEILTFNQIVLVKGLESSENCRQLVVLGHWINKPYEVVCPQFSQTVRNTVTPFVTFILGLFTAMIIIRFVNNRGIS